MIDIEALKLRVSAIGAALGPRVKPSKAERKAAKLRKKVEDKKVRQVEYALSVAAKAVTHYDDPDVARAEYEMVAATQNVASLPPEKFAELCELVWAKRVAKRGSKGFKARRLLIEQKQKVASEFAAIEERALNHVEQPGANAVAGTIYSKIAASRPVNRTTARVVSGGR